jgi:hypothetical protein
MEEKMTVSSELSRQGAMKADALRHAPDFSPVIMAPAGFLPEKDSVPDAGILASFLINALYLVGNHRILVSGSLGAEVTETLTRFGHRVDAGREAFSVPRAAAGARHDRAVSAGRALGYGTDAENRDWLRSMHKALAPGGLICFHVFDRDRAWNLAGDRELIDDGRGLRVRIGFDPADGRLSQRILATGGAETSVRAYNLLEIRALLESSGFALERAYGDWDGSGPEAGGARTGRLIVVASKRRVRPRRPGLREPSAQGRPG